ncbi:GDP-mannose 4,6-dehydratase [Sneathiella marina]|uniref:GDP-mannose 4,6-dehydratase n=1 Tax=Sneathiella marina TaxID=2950108 RepID=A0ABY4W7I4_9PROT|nr:NAD-dependent epimerase/dehydratase family protein [Sneathiella marina]USG62806.1 GDP-mannose 4,6-dehydratase [Sneathiella marina]
MTKKWVITGGCGFIGSALIAKLTRDVDNAVRVIDNLSVGSIKPLEKLNIPIVHADVMKMPIWQKNVLQHFEIDIRDQDRALKVTEGADIIVHLAANTGVGPSVSDPRADCMSNVIGVFNYLEAARLNSVPRFILASSSAVVGDTTSPVHEEKVPHPTSPYGASKLCGEAYCSAYFQTFGIETVALRFGNVYGIGAAHKESVVSKFMKTLLQQDPLTIFGDGSQTRDFIYIEDLVEAITAAAVASDVGGEVFQIATNRETSVNELVDVISSTVEQKGYTRPKILNQSKRIGDIMNIYSDTSKARQKLNWRSKTALQRGIEDTFDWFVSEQKQ